MSRRGHKSNSLNTIVYKQETTAAIKYGPIDRAKRFQQGRVRLCLAATLELGIYPITVLRLMLQCLLGLCLLSGRKFGEAFCLSIHLFCKKEKDEHLLTSLLPHSSSQRYSSINKGSEDLCIIVCFSLKKSN